MKTKGIKMKLNKENSDITIQIAKILKKKETLEKLLLRYYGYKFNLEVEEVEKKNGDVYIQFFQAHVMTGSQLGILGETIINVDFLITLFPYEVKEKEVDKYGNIIPVGALKWWGTINLQWQHPTGSNGHDIGDIRYYDNDPIDFNMERRDFTIIKTRR